ncbi:MAG: radical SAM protein [Acidobacteriota bacterium]
MTDLLLAHGYFLRNDPLEQRIMRPYVPLGFLYVSSYLKSRGFETAVFDATWRDLPDFRVQLRRLRPRAVGIYANIVTRPFVKEMIAASRAEGIPVVVGGPDGFARKEVHLESGADVIVKGEAELTLHELLGRIRDGARPGDELAMAGVTYRKPGGEIVVGPDRAKIEELDPLPWPDRAAVDLRPYFENWRRVHGETSLALITARGCPYSCAWCSRQVFGKSHRQRTPGNVVLEMLHLKEAYRPDKLWISDDVLTMKRRWVLDFVDEVKRRDAAIPFEGVTRVNLVDDEILGALRSIGCFRLWYGAESGVQRIVDRMQKGYKVERILAATREAQSHGIKVGHFIMLGYPTETRDDVLGTIRFLDESRPDHFGVAVAFPLEGTRFYEEVKDEIIEENVWTGRNMNRVSFRTRYPALFYWFAVRLVQSEVPFRRLRREGYASPRNLVRFLALGAKTATCRAATYVLAREFAHRVESDAVPASG